LKNDPWEVSLIEHLLHCSMVVVYMVVGMFMLNCYAIKSRAFRFCNRRCLETDFEKFLYFCDLNFSANKKVINKYHTSILIYFIMKNTKTFNNNVIIICRPA